MVVESVSVCVCARVRVHACVFVLFVLCYFGLFFFKGQNRVQERNDNNNKAKTV